MKNRIKQFCEDHQVGTFVTASLAVAATIVVAHKMKGKDVKQVDYWSREDGSSVILVGLRNGDNRVFSKNSSN